MEVSKALYQENNFRELYNRFYRPLVSFAIQRIQHEDVAEDIVQEVFVHLWTDELVFENEIALKSYLYHSVLNRCLNYIRDQKNRIRHEALLIKQQETLDNSLLNEIVREEVYRLLAEVVDTLPPQCRRIYDLVQAGLKSSEIAERLGLAVETVKRQRKIARKMIADRLGNMTFFLFIAGKLKI